MNTRIPRSQYNTYKKLVGSHSTSSYQHHFTGKSATIRNPTHNNFLQGRSIAISNAVNSVRSSSLAIRRAEKVSNGNLRKIVAESPMLHHLQKGVGTDDDIFVFP